MEADTDTASMIGGSSVVVGGVFLGQGGGPPLLCPAYLPCPVGVTGAGSLATPPPYLHSMSVAQRRGSGYEQVRPD